MTTELHPIHWAGSISEAQGQAVSEGKPLLIYFSAAPDCAQCVRFETETLDDRRVVEFVERHFAPVKIAMAEGQPIAEQYKVGTAPAIVVAGEHGHEPDRIEGFLPPEDLLAQLSLRAGRWLLERGHFDKARDRFDEVSRRHPGTAAAAEAERLSRASRNEADRLVGEASEESFPASDPPAWTLGRS